VSVASPPWRPAGWRGRDIAAGLGLLVLGYMVVVAIVVAVVVVGDPLEDPNAALGVALATLLFELWIGAIVLILASRRSLSLGEIGFAWPRRWWLIVATVFGAYGIVMAYSIGVVVVEDVTGVDLSRFTEGNPIPDSDANTRTVWTVLGLSIVLAAPVCEELFFRGFLFRALEATRGYWLAMLASGLAFALVHFEVSVIIPFWGIGMLFAWAYRATRSLWTPIAAHAIFNGLSFLVTVSGIIEA
jgi:uncharacterized protein